MLTLAFKAVNYDFMLVAVKSPRPPSAAMTAERDPITYIYITNDDLPTLVQSAVYNHISISSLGFGTTKGYVRKLRGHSSPTIESVSANTPCFLDKLALAVGAHFGSGFDAPEFKAAFSAALQRIAIRMQHRKASGGPYLDTGAAAKMLRSLAARSLVGYAEFRTFIGEAAITLLHGRSFTALWDGHEKRVHLDQDGLYRCRWSPIHPSPFAPVHQEMPVEGANVQNGSFNNMDGIGQLSWPSVPPAMPFAPVYQQMPIEGANVQNRSFNNVDSVS
ncbi:unnamed protein product [Zymoseptoria tritici ST99CH_3D1]|nr:unnamed protein product [Zymoseptoria tritici ST99CH_3D1]